MRPHGRWNNADNPGICLFIKSNYQFTRRKRILGSRIKHMEVMNYGSTTQYAGIKCQ